MSNFQNNSQNSSQKKIFIRANFQIKAQQVRCITHTNENIGVVSFDYAMGLAREAELDLIQISYGQDGIPVCKITDYGKYKFELSKKQKETAKKQRESAIKIKEIKFHPNTSENDLKTKANKILDFINDGNKVKISIVFRGREMSHKEVGVEQLNKFLEFVPGLQIVGDVQMNGKIMTVMAEKRNAA
jgi:translation initiation factor IF-3